MAKQQKVIDKLTPEQEAMIPVFQEKFEKIALSTEPIDMKAAEGAIRDLYDLLEEPQPERIRLAKGPMEAWEMVCDEYGLMYNSSKEEIENFKQHFILTNCHGNLSAGYCAFAEYLEYLGLELPDIYYKWRSIMNVHLVWPTIKCAVLCERPFALNLDENDNLHCTDGPAYGYHDGTEIYAINGIILDKCAIMTPTQQTLEMINGESNMDARAIRIERYGWIQFLDKIKAKVLDQRGNDVDGTYEVLYETKDYGNRFVANCVSGKIPAMGVPSSVKTCETAQQWLRNNKKVNMLGRT